MRRLVLAAAAAAAALGAAACGSSSTGGASSASSTSSTGTDAGGGGRGGLARNAAAGEVVQLSGTKLVLNTTQSGDVNVTFAATTPVSKTSTGSLGDITDGECLTATGQKDSTGTFTATTVNISDPVGGSCTAGGGLFGGPGAGNRSPNPSFSPNPSRSPRPGGQNGMVIRGQVTAENGVSITLVQLGGASSGQSTTITVPTTATVSKTASATASDIAVGDCVAAIGPKDSSGTVTATTLAISPAGPSGCFTGRGAFGGFGGFRGGGGGTPAAAGTTNG